MVCRWEGGGGKEKGGGGECSVNGEGLLSKLSPPKMPTLSFGGGLHLGVPCRGALLGRVEQEGEKTSSDQYPKGP